MVRPPYGPELLEMIRCTPWSPLILENNLCQGEVAAMCNRKRNIFHAETVGDSPRGAREPQSRFPAGFARHFDVSPPDAAAPTGAERFHRRFFGGKSRRVTFEPVLVAFAVGNFAGREQRSENRSAMARDRSFNPVDFGDVQAQSDDHRPLVSSGVKPAAKFPAQKNSQP